MLCWAQPTLPNERPKPHASSKVENLESQLDGIYGLLDYHQSGDQQLLQQSLHCLLDSDARLQRLENQLADVQEELPLAA